MRRRTVLALSVLSALTLAACNGGGAGGGEAGGEAPACRSQTLALKRVSEDAATSLVTYRFENRGSRSCRLQGYPAITLTGPDGAPVAVSVEHFAPAPALSARKVLVVLRPGTSGDFNVVFPKDAGKGACKPFVKLTATPPGSDWGLDVPEDAKLCEGTMLVSTFTIDPADVS